MNTVTTIPDNFSARFPFLTAVQEPEIKSALSPTSSHSPEHTIYFNPIQQQIIIHRTTPITVRKADPYNKKFYLSLFKDYSNLLVVFPTDRKTFTSAKLKTLNASGINCNLEADFQTNINDYLLKHIDHLPRQTIPNSSWSGDKGSACEDQFFRNTSYALADNNKYTETFRDPNGKPYGAMSDAFCPITGQHIEIKSRGLNTHPDKETCTTMTNKLRASNTYDKFTALWHGWSHNIYKQHGVSQKLQDKFVILFPDNAVESGKLSDLDMTRMLALDIDYDTFSGYQQRINNNMTSYLPNLGDCHPKLAKH